MGKVVKIVASIGLIVAGVVTGNPALIIQGVSMGAGTLMAPKKPKQSLAAADRLQANIDPGTHRKIALGRTALNTDIRDAEYTGSDQEYFHEFIVTASHKITSYSEIWFDDKKVWTTGGGVQGEAVGYLTVAVREEGSAANAINISARMGTTRRYTGLAYIHLRFKLTGNSKKAESPYRSIPTRVTIKGEGAKLYDPRLDTTVGGSGAHRAADQTTWEFTHSGVEIGRNPALQLLWYLLGWKVNGKLIVGKGVPVSRIDLDSFMTAANLCDESVSLAAGGTEPRYRSDGVFSEGDQPETVIAALEAAMNGRLRDLNGRFTLSVLNGTELATPVAAFTDDDVIGAFTWDQTGGLEETPNVMRGKYCDPSDNSLFQMVDYPAVRLASVDGIDRVHTMDLAMVQSPSQAQRLAKQELQRVQYLGRWTGELKATGWGCKRGDIVTLTFPTLGFVNKLFRVEARDVRVDGVVPIVLREENEDSYAWDEDEEPAVVAADPTVYLYTNNPLLGGIDDAGATADWASITSRPTELTDGRIADAINSDGTIANDAVIAASLSADLVSQIVSASASNIDGVDAGTTIVTLPDVNVKPSQGGYVHMILTAQVGRNAGSEWNGLYPETNVCYVWLQRSPAGAGTWTHLEGYLIYSTAAKQTSFYVTPPSSDQVFLTFISGEKISASAQFFDIPPSDGDYDYRWVASKVLTPGSSSSASTTIARIHEADALGMSVKVAS